MHGVPAIAPLTVITGHYGVGKTNLAINLALDLARGYDEVMVVDLDIVNPYFRSSDYTDELESHGVRFGGPFTDAKTSYPSDGCLYYSGNETTPASLPILAMKVFETSDCATGAPGVWAGGDVASTARFGS